MGSIRVVHGADLLGGRDRDGITRRTGHVDDQSTLGLATIEPGSISRWHHHGDHTSYVYVLRGRLHIDWEAGGEDGVDLTGGDFYVVPPKTVHREGNPGADELVLAVVYLGTGPLSVEVEHAETQPVPARGTS